MDININFCTCLIVYIRFYLLQDEVTRQLSVKRLDSVVCIIH